MSGCQVRLGKDGNAENKPVQQLGSSRQPLGLAQRAAPILSPTSRMAALLDVTERRILVASEAQHGMTRAVNDAAHGQTRAFVADQHLATRDVSIRGTAAIMDESIQGTNAIMVQNKNAFLAFAAELQAQRGGLSTNPSAPASEAASGTSCAGDDVADADAGAAANSPPNSDASCAAADGTASVVDDRALPATEEAGREATESAAAAPKAAAPKAAAPKAARKPKLTQEQAYWKGTAYAFFGATPAVEAARVLRQRRMARRKDPAYESKMRRPAELTSHA